MVTPEKDEIIALGFELLNETGSLDTENGHRISTFKKNNIWLHKIDSDKGRKNRISLYIPSDPDNKIFAKNNVSIETLTEEVKKLNI